jgi:hypothetical protein
VQRGVAGWLGGVVAGASLACSFLSKTTWSREDMGQRERAGSSVAQGAEVWGRAAVLERVQHLVGGRLGEGGVRERKCRIW